MKKYPLVDDACFMKVINLKINGGKLDKQRKAELKWERSYQELFLLGVSDNSQTPNPCTYWHFALYQ